MLIPELKKISINGTKKLTGKRRANALTGSEWVKNSISIWSDIRFAPEERAFRHPAMFPGGLPDKLLKTFTSEEDKIILDPFCGSGSTLVNAVKHGKVGIGFELYDKFLKIAETRLKSVSGKAKKDYFLIKDDCRNASKYIPNNTIDFAFTSPPYWDILKQKRTADLKENEDYGKSKEDLGNEENYEKFLENLKVAFEQVYLALKPKRYFIVNVMDLRKGPQFFPLHVDAISRAEDAGFFLDDIIIWDRRLDYNNLRALGYPAVFRVNKVHEFLLVFRKPEAQESN